MELHEHPRSNRYDAGADGAGSCNSAITTSDRSHVAASASQEPRSAPEMPLQATPCSGRSHNVAFGPSDDAAVSPGVFGPKTFVHSLLEDAGYVFEKYELQPNASLEPVTDAVLEDASRSLPSLSTLTPQATSPPELLQDEYVPPKAPPLQLLEQGNVSAAEGLVFFNYLQQGMKLEKDLEEAKQSFEAAQRTRETDEANRGPSMSATYSNNRTTL